MNQLEGQDEHRERIRNWLETGGDRLQVDFPQQAVAAGADAGWRVIELTLTEPTDKAALMHAFQRAFGLPGWFGHNWDALVDSLRDVQPAEGQPGVLVVWSGSAMVDPDDRQTALEILAERAQQHGADFKLALSKV